MKKVLLALAGFGCSLACSQSVPLRTYATPPAPASDLTVETSGIGSAGVCGNPSVTLVGGNAGDLVVCTVTGQASASAVSDGTSSFTALTQVGTGAANARMFYLLSANGAGKTYTATVACLGATKIQCIDVNATVGKTWHFEAANQQTATGAAISSGAVSTTHGDEIVYFTPWASYPSGGTCIGSSALNITGLNVSQPAWSPFSVVSDNGCVPPPVENQYAAYLLLGSGISATGNLTIGSSEQWAAAIGAWYAQ